MPKKSPAARFANIRDESSHEYPVAVARPPAIEAVVEPAPATDRAGLVPAVDVAPTPVRQGRGKPEAASGAPSRSGKGGMQLWVEANTRKRLKLYATVHDRSLEDVLGEAVADFLRKHDA